MDEDAAGEGGDWDADPFASKTNWEVDPFAASIALKESTSVAPVPSLTTMEESQDVAMCVTKQSLECWDITDIEEQWTKEDEEMAKEGVDNNNGDSVGNSSGKSGGDAHIEKLLSSYFEGEEDKGIVNWLKSGELTKGLKIENEDMGEAGEIDEKDQNALTGTASMARKVDDDGTEERQEDIRHREAGWARASLKEEVELYFQCRVCYYPKQVLRYAYGGEPLWISHPNPLMIQKSAGSSSSSTVAEQKSVRIESSAVTEEFVAYSSKKNKKKENKEKATTNPAGKQSTVPPHSIIPHCEWCGAARVFECQLMPALLLYATPCGDSTKQHTCLPPVPPSAVSDPASGGDLTSSTNPRTAPPNVEELLGNSLDFGVVAIWSCPNSCDPPAAKERNIAKEFALVQGPPDFC